MVGAIRRARALLILAPLGVIAAAASCSLDLDESLIDKRRDAGFVVEGDSGSGAEADGGADSGSSGQKGSVCTKDEECTSTHGCLKGKCDQTRKRCVYDVCHPAACNASACDQGARTCAPPAAYKYKAGQFGLGAPSSCTRCVAAVHPWLFVVTAAGVVAYDVSNPANPSPRQVPIVGLGFVPGALVQSGSRVWMTGGMSGAGPSWLQLAYIDAPADPFTTTIEAHTAFVRYSRPSEGASIFARSGDSALLVGPQAAQFPSAIVEPPLEEPVSLTATPLSAVANTGPVAVSGKRLLMAGNAGGVATFNLIDNAGSTTPTSGPAVNLTDAGQVSNQRVFAQSADGSIFFATGVHHTPAVDTLTRAVRGYFLVPNGEAALEGTVGVDMEVYSADPVGANAPVFGPGASAAMLDAKTVMIAMQARENAAQTAVEFVGREPLGVLRRHVLPVPIGAVQGTAASNGVGYLVANDVAGPPAAGTVYVFDPACGP